VNTLVLLTIALRAIGRNKVRAALTMLGIVIGVGSVIAMIAIGRGATSMIKKQVSAMGQNMIMVFPGSSSSGAVMFGAGTQSTLSPKDAESILRECPSAVAVGIVVRTRGQLVYGSVNWAPATVQGCNPAFLEVRNWPLQSGEVFSESDVARLSQVCLIGTTVARQVFGDEDPIGRTMRLKGLPVRVIGVLEKKGANTYGQDQDDAVLLPWSTVKKKIQGSTFDSVDQLLVGAISESHMKRLEKEVAGCLRAAHRKKASASADDDFTLRSSTEMLAALTSTTRIMTMLLAAIASISLVVGGIGIMNMMLVSVSERTREIGLRMALGARGRDILLQFLVEAATLSLMGGAIGLVVGGVATTLVARLAKWPTLLSPDTAAIAIAFSAAVGIFFGFYPAWRASRLDPIEALRYE
jgi:putative ABC transport system permease protein